MTGSHRAPLPFRAPEHVVNEWARLIDGWNPAGPDAPPRGSKEYAERVRAQARMTADRVHAEAFSEGVQWAMEHMHYRQRVVVAEGTTAFDAVVDVTDQLLGRRLSYSDFWSEPAPVRMSVIRPEEYRPDLCPRCQEPVTDWLVQYPAVAGDRYGPAERVLLKPCHHSIKFMDDTLEENRRAH